MTSPWLVLLLSVVAGCYENPPPRVPRPQLPAVVAGTELEVDSRVDEEDRPVTKHDRVCIGSDCSTVSVTSSERVRVHHAAASYGGTPLTLGQAQALADPAYLRDWSRMDELAAHCRHASVPKLVGEVLLLAGMVLVIDGTATSDGSTNMPYAVAGAAGMAGGIAAYALGKYALGGQDCEEANELYQRRRSEWRAQDDRDVEDELATELETIAKGFNERTHATAGVTPVEPAAEE